MSRILTRDGSGVGLVAARHAAAGILKTESRGAGDSSLGGMAVGYAVTEEKSSGVKVARPVSAADYFRDF